MKKNIVFGASGLIGSAFYKILKNNKNFIFYSKSNKKFNILNLNNNLTGFPLKEIDHCYFFSSPRILKKNFTQNNFRLELDWLKKVISNIKINKFIYISSSSVYYQKNHIIGSVKLRCEKYIIQKKKLFNNYQIWRPFNLVGDKYLNSDHFHNYLFKQMFLKKKSNHIFSGNPSDKRGYADVNHFVRVMHKHSKLHSSFIRNYGNKDLVKISEIINLFNTYYEKINKKKFKPTFKSDVIDVNIVKSTKNTVFYNKKSLIILKKFLKKSLNENKM